MSYCVIVLSKTQAKLDACIAAIRASGCKERIIVVWDASEVYSLPTITDANTTLIMESQAFVFARNANTGIHAAGAADVILLNDDAIVETTNGLDALHMAALDAVAVGVVSALIRGGAAAVEQTVGHKPPAKVTDKPSFNFGQVRPIKHHMLAFVAVHIRRRVFDMIGMLDERYTGYGTDDDDFCRRCLDFGLSLSVFDGCIVEHGCVPSTFRGDGSASSVTMQPNRERFKAKFGKYPWEFK